MTIGVVELRVQLGVEEVPTGTQKTLEEQVEVEREKRCQRGCVHNLCTTR